jgi:GNAT superfamily N-acetyltransferase
VDRTIDLGAERVLVRPLSPTDSAAELTEMLHRAYARLAAAGWNYTATDQDEAVTLRRCATGTCLVGVLRGRLVATITWRPPAPDRECAWFSMPGVFSFEQFGVDPDLQGRGLGAHLLEGVEEDARAAGAREIACDTAEPARHLVYWYVRRGYRVVERVRWAGKTYPSVVLSKSLLPLGGGAAPLRDPLAAQPQAPPA